MRCDTFITIKDVFFSLTISKSILRTLQAFNIFDCPFMGWVKDLLVVSSLSAFTVPWSVYNSTKLEGSFVIHTTLDTCISHIRTLNITIQDKWQLFSCRLVVCHYVTHLVVTYNDVLGWFISDKGMDRHVTDISLHSDIRYVTDLRQSSSLKDTYIIVVKQLSN